MVTFRNKHDVLTALQQIKEKRYTQAVERYTGEILLVGASYDKKSRKYQCVMEKSHKESEKGAGRIFDEK